MPIIVETTGTDSAVVLKRLWLNLASDDTVYRAFRLASYTHDDGVRAEVRTLANGRERVIRRAGGVKTMQAILRHPDADDRAWLEAHVGETVWVRDPDGGKFAGVYLAFQRNRTPGPVGEDVTVSFRRVTATEAV